jgi:hypothetical protein
MEADKRPTQNHSEVSSEREPTSGAFRWESALLRASTEGAMQLLQLCILGFGLLEDRDVRVGVFPERKEILIGRSCLGVITR